MKPGGLLLTLVLATGGCVYYNGMYNARRLAHEAEKAERDGRRFDAQNYWAQAEIKADSVIARHPDSGWFDDALVIKSKAAIKRSACEEAVPYLERVLVTSPDDQLVDEANMLLGGCYYQMGRPMGAAKYLMAASASGDSARRTEAQGLYGSALNRMQRYPEALSVLSGHSGPRWDLERAVALAGSGDVERSLQLADSMMSRRDTAVAWDSLLVVVGRVDLASASELTDRIVAAADSMPAEVRASYYLADGIRWVSVDRDRAVARLEQAAADSAARRTAAKATLRLARLRLATVGKTEDLAPVRDLLQKTIGSGGSAELLGRRLAETAKRIESVSDTLSADSPGGDLEMFLLAEAARDTLEAAPLARSFFHRIPRTWPRSPYAPKAMLALADLTPDSAAFYHQFLVTVYPDSPYLTFIGGLATGEFVALEDSLRSFARSRVTRQQPRRRANQRGRNRNRVRDDLEAEEDLP